MAGYGTNGQIIGEVQRPRAWNLRPFERRVAKVFVGIERGR